MKLSFLGTHALVLGGSSDLGLEVARLLIQEKIFPWLTCRSRSGEEKIHQQLISYKGNYQTLHFDFGEMETITAMFDEIGRDLDYLIDFAQGDLEGLVGSLDNKDVTAYFSENISARAEVVKQSSRVMLGNKKGRMLFISSAAAENPNPGQGFYAASKLASEALYRNAGIELANYGITTLSLRPGYIDAGRGKEYLSEKQAIPSGQKPRTFITVQEMAETTLFFLSDSAARFTTSIVSVGEHLKKINRYRMSIFNEIKQIIAEILDIEEDEVISTAYLMRDLGAESIDLLELAVSLNGAFQIEILDDDIFLRKLRRFLEEAKEKGQERKTILKQYYPFLSEVRIEEILADLNQGPVLKVEDLVSYITYFQTDSHA